MKCVSVSIITLTYKNWQILERAICSVFAQDYTHICEVEYLIVDDGTDDFNIEFVSCLIDKYKNEFKSNDNLSVRIIENISNMGTVASFNNAIKQSRGDLIIPLSADDCFHDNNTVSKIFENFKNSNVKIITAQRTVFCQNMIKAVETIPHVKYAGMFEKGKEKKLLNWLVLKGNIISGASTYYHRELFNEYGFFDTKYKLLEDLPFYCKLLSNEVNIAFLPVPTVNYRLGGISNLSNVNPLLKNDYKTLKLELLSNPKVCKYGKRKLSYSTNLSKKEKLKPLNIVKYFDLCFLVFFSKAFLLLKNLIRFTK